MGTPRFIDWFIAVGVGTLLVWLEPTLLLFTFVVAGIGWLGQFLVQDSLFS
ncbi:hypothetical protein G6M89_05850 [Natronolimnobius sp. AArcel1]|uniref:hypothetical protein n=1 Tax=Natronolimnobius sp. AArcel1 TaxID=1679093 RepID=UPI0013EAFC58|nr:hypothetical protein [Natronolimnobius sp. AArcel1]NGM68539.1 hypothetical protein [Natronolimnobius sp. AArcel1]